jgi:hypothetical protein
MSGPCRPRICLFVGPSLSSADIRAAFGTLDADVQVLPPVQQGDILRLLEQLPEVIGLIDGYFFHAPSVLHREILLALERGARVLGSSSIGALRAAELDVFGMEGVGEVYGLYRQGAIDGDDEVAVLHATADEGFRPLSEALVSIRHNLGRARRRRIISAASAAKALACAKRLHFSQRTYEAVLGAVAEEERAALGWFLFRETSDLKREDALRLVRTIVARIDGSQAWPPRVPIRVNQTSHFHRYQREYVGRSLDGCHIPDDVVLAFERLLSPSFPGLYERVALRCLALDEAAFRGLVAEDPEVLVARFRRARHLGFDPAWRTWLRDRFMSQDELVQLVRELNLEAQVVALYRTRNPGVRGRAALLGRVARDVAARNGITKHVLTHPLLMYPGVPWSGPLIRELKLRGGFAAAFDLAFRILRHNADIFERNPRLAHAPVRRGLLNEFFAERWGVEGERLEAIILERGFAGYGDFVQAARHAYIYENSLRAGPNPDWQSLSDCFHLDS